MMLHSIRSHLLTALGLLPAANVRDDLPQINIAGHANVQLGDRYRLPTKAEREDYKRRKALEKAEQRRQVVRDRLQTAVAGIQFTLHWTDILQVYTHRPNSDVFAATTEALTRVDDIPGLFKRRFLKDTQTTTNDDETCGESTLFEAIRSCIEHIDRFEALLLDNTILEPGTDFHTSSSQLQEIQTKIVASVFLLLCWDSEPMEYSSAAERTIARKIRHFHLCRPEITRDIISSVNASRDESQPSATSKARIDQWISQYKDDFSECAKEIASKLMQQHETQIRYRISDGLDYTEMDHRYYAVTRAQARTFDWVFKSQNPQKGFNISFAEWLADTDSSLDRVYWIRGKPGSGKSTLMRYLNDHDMTRKIAKTWSESKELLVIKCFFWSSGSHMQKSQRGLLQTLLFQMLRERPDYPRIICPAHWDLIASRFIASYATAYLAPLPTMSLVEIQKAISNFALYYGDNTKMLLLIDGLDEFQGNDEDRRDVCMMLKQLSNAENVKVCTASRPWNVYTDFFDSSPQLRLELLTQTDISIYVADALGADPRFERLQRIEPEATQQVIKDIVRKAEGVFLWVVLVIKSILKGVQDGDNVQELRRILKEIPSDLSDLFEQMLSKVNPAHLESASQMFDIAMHNSHLALVYFFIHVDEHADELAETVRERGLKRVLELQELEERRINARCMGLLELCPSSEGIGGTISGLRTVGFLHRTARDYMESQKDLLASWRKSPWDPLAALNKSTLFLVLSCDTARLWLAPKALANYCQNIFAQLDHTSLASECLEMILVNEQHFEKMIRALAMQRHFMTCSISPADFPDLLTFAIVQGADVYAMQKLQQLADVNSPGRRPLLHYTLNPVYRMYRASALGLTTALLKLGANPNAVWHGATVWSETIQFVPVIASRGKENPRLVPAFVDSLKLLMTAGASDFRSLEYERGRIVDSRRMIEWNFHGEVANDLLAVGKRAHVHEDPHSLRTVLKARMRRWVIGGNRSG